MHSRTLTLDANEAISETEIIEPANIDHETDKLFSGAAPPTTRRFAIETDEDACNRPATLTLEEKSALLWTDSIECKNALSQDSKPPPAYATP
jgi:hypothetical protein